MLQGILLAATVAEFDTPMCPILTASTHGMACVLDGLSSKWPSPICRCAHATSVAFMSNVHIVRVTASHDATSGQVSGAAGMCMMVHLLMGCMWAGP